MKAVCRACVSSCKVDTGDNVISLPRECIFGIATCDWEEEATETLEKLRGEISLLQNMQVFYAPSRLEYFAAKVLAAYITRGGFSVQQPSQEVLSVAAISLAKTFLKELDKEQKTNVES